MRRLSRRRLLGALAATVPALLAGCTDERDPERHGIYVENHAPDAELLVTVEREGERIFEERISSIDGSETVTSIEETGSYRVAAEIGDASDAVEFEYPIDPERRSNTIVIASSEEELELFNEVLD